MSNTRPAGTVDYDVHGLAGIRLVDASAADAAGVARQLGPLQKPLEREPEIVIRFVDSFDRPAGAHYLGLAEAAYTDDAFFVIDGAGEFGARIPFEAIGGRCEIVCESGRGAVPLLVPIVNLTVLAAGWVPVHASAFTFAGTGVLAAGWAKGGKTEALLAFMANGARYIGDEWVYVSPEGDSLRGLPEPIKIWDWHLPDLPGYRTAVPGTSRVRWSAIKATQALERRLPTRVGRTRGGTLSRLMPLLQRQLYVHVGPHELFGPSACSLAGSLDKVVLLVSGSEPDVRVEQVNAEEVAARMVPSLEHERLKLLSYYLKFRFAFPERANALIEGSDERQRAMLRAALTGKDAYVVHHPFPAPIPALFDAIRPLLET